MKKRCVALLIMGGLLAGAVCLRLPLPARQEAPVEDLDCQSLVGFGVRPEGTGGSALEGGEEFRVWFAAAIEAAAVEQVRLYGAESFASCSEASNRFR